MNKLASDRVAARLADPDLVLALSQFVRARVPPDEVDDIVQATLVSALAAQHVPDLDDEVIRWVYRVCRHKVVDWFRRARREVPSDLAGDDEHPSLAVGESEFQSAVDLLRWAHRELPEGEEHARTLEWMLREGEGEKLEAIAVDADVPAPRVRQRVSR
jgi:DNA-directed RNA polymerase specialized sigma24 family protein